MRRASPLRTTKVEAVNAVLSRRCVPADLHVLDAFAVRQFDEWDPAGGARGTRGVVRAFASFGALLIRVFLECYPDIAGWARRLGFYFAYHTDIVTR